MAILIATRIRDALYKFGYATGAKVEYVVVLNTETRNEFMRQAIENYGTAGPDMDKRFMGCVLAVTHLDGADQIAIYERPLP